MKEIAQMLFSIDRFIFDRKNVQYGLLAFFGITLLGTMIGLFAASGFFIWLCIGLAVYVVLFAYRFMTNEQELPQMKRMYQEKGVMPFMKGLNYSLILGPFGLILAMFLALMPKRK